MDQDRAKPLMTRQPRCLPAGLYYARLFLDHDWPMDGVAGHLRSAADVVDRESDGPAWRSACSACWAGAGRADALALLREYVTEGWNWRCALDELSETGSPQALEGLADAILGRLTDQELAAGVTAGLGPWQEWAANQPRVSAALGERELRRKKVNAERRGRRSPG